MSKPQKMPSGNWRIQFHNADGKRQSRMFPTYAQARAELHRVKVDTADTTTRRERFGSIEMTVAEAWEAFTVGRRRDSYTTERRFTERGNAHRRAYEHHIRPHLDDKRLSDLTPQVLREWIGQLMATPTARPGEHNSTGRCLSAGTIRSVVVTLRQIAKAQDVPLVVMLAAPLRQKRRRTRPRALQSVGEVESLLVACSDPWFRVAAAIACYTGARLGEVASLRWRNIDELTELITLEHSWEGPLKSRYEDGEDAARVVALAPRLADILRAWRAVTDGRDEDHVVLVHGKRPLAEHVDDVAAKTRAACKRAGLAPVTFHGLRATWATLLADQGLPLSKLSVLLGHRDVATTAIYVRSESASAASDPRARLTAHVLHTTEENAAATVN